MPKLEKKRSARSLSQEGSDDDRKVKKAKATPSKSDDLGKGKDDEGNPYWELSRMRRVGISKFKNNVLVNVREYYANDGELRPGKKGISLSIDQYKALIKAVPAINAELRSQGHEVEDLAAEEEAAVPEKRSKKAKSPVKKANIEATSDEESE